MSALPATVCWTVDITDDELVAAVRDGDDRAFEALYARYEGRITAFVMGKVRDHARAEDVTQDVFFSALRRMRQTERPIAFKPWIYEIARNACIDQFRRTKRAEELSIDDEARLATGDHVRLVSTTAEPDVAVESKQRLEHLQGAFGGLSEQHHQILLLRELEGLSYREIGDRMGLSRTAVESTLFRARRRLGEEYDDLITGRRCERVQATIDAAGQGALGVRDQRRLDRHLSCCQACRQHARRAGAGRPGLAGKLAALMPFPMLRRSRGDGVAGAQAASAQGGSLQNLLMPWTTIGGAAAEPVASWGAKAVATLATIAVAGLGVGAATDRGPLTLSDFRSLPLVSVLAGEDRDHGTGSGSGTSVGAPGTGAAAQDGRPGSPARGDAGGSTPGSANAPGAGTGPDGLPASGGGVDLPGIAPPGAPGANVSGPKAPDAPGAPSAPNTPRADPPSAPELNVPQTQAPKPEAPSLPSAPSAPKVNAPAPSPPSTPSAPKPQSLPKLPVS